ncbi:MAG: hypothetical protein ACK5MQ_01445, partial [Pikeienuella sp.]
TTGRQSGRWGRRGGKAMRRSGLEEGRRPMNHNAPPVGLYLLKHVLSDGDIGQKDEIDTSHALNKRDLLLPQVVDSCRNNIHYNTLDDGAEHDYRKHQISKQGSHGLSERAGQG